MTSTGSDRAPTASIRDAPSPATVLRVELTKLGRGLPFWMSLLLPFALILPLGMIAMASPEGREGDVWGVWFSVTLLFWGVFQPMSAALYAGASVRADLGARRVVYAYGFPRHRLFLGKYVALLVAGLCSALLLTVLLGAVGAFLAGPDALARVPAGVLVPWACGAASLALSLVAAEKWGTGAAMGIGVVGMMLSGTVADTAEWWALPLVWPMRAVVPLAGIEASGVPLEAGDPLLSSMVLPFVIALSVVSSFVLIAAGVRHVNRKEL